MKSIIKINIETLSRKDRSIIEKLLNLNKDDTNNAALDILQRNKRQPDTANTVEDVELVKAIKSQLTAEEADKVIVNYAFGRLYDKYKEVITYKCRAMVSNEETLKDLVSKTYIRAYEKIHLYEPEKGAFTTWLFTISRNLYIDFIRNEKASITTVTSEMGATSEDGQTIPFEIKDDSAKDGQQIYEKKERAKLVNRVIDSCFDKKPFLKDLIRMRFFEEKSYDEIVQVTNKPLGTIKVDLMRAKDKLKVALEAEGLEYF